MRPRQALRALVVLAPVTLLLAVNAALALWVLAATHLNQQAVWLAFMSARCAQRLHDWMVK